MNSIVCALDRVNKLIEEVKEEVNANIENIKEDLREELRAELREEFNEVNQHLITRIEHLEVLIGTKVFQEPVREEPVREEPVKRKKSVKKQLLEDYYIEEDSYTPAEIKKMDSYVLCAEFSRLVLKGETTMCCTHCKKPTHLNKWVNSIRKRCLKSGLDSNTQIPKTCDVQQAVNAIVNPINNRVYPKLRDPKLSVERKELWSQYRKIMLSKLGINVHPQKYMF